MIKVDKVSKIGDMGKGKSVTDSYVPFGHLAYVTTDIITQTNSGMGMFFYGTRAIIPEILENMDKKREFSGDKLFPDMKSTAGRGLNDEALTLMKDAEMLEDAGNGRYRAKKQVYVKQGMFKLPERSLRQTFLAALRKLR